MKRSKIFLRTKLSEHEIILLKKDLFDHALQNALKIKNLNFDKKYIEEVVKNAVDRVLLTFKFGDGNSLGDAIKTQVISDLRAEYLKTYPDKADKVLWPDLDKGKYFIKLIEVLKKVKILPKEVKEPLVGELSALLTMRQQNWLNFIYDDLDITYVELSKKFGARGVHPSEEVKAIYVNLIKVLKDLEIGI